MKQGLSKSSLAVALLLTLTLSGCSNREELAQQAMTEIRESLPQSVPPMPEAQVVEDYIYSANDERSPFLPPSLLNLNMAASENSNIRPDVHRTKQPLEKFELAELIYRGMVVAPNGQQYGLVQRPDGSIANVQVGEYMGVNDGRIVEITPTQINLIEILPDSRAGYVEKPQSLVSPIS